MARTPTWRWPIRDARCWAGAVDRTVGLGTSYGLALCLRLLALVDLLARARWAIPLFRLERDGADLHPSSAAHRRDHAADGRGAIRRNAVPRQPRTAPDAIAGDAPPDRSARMTNRSAQLSPSR